MSKNTRGSRNDLGWLCFPSPSTQLPIIFTLRGFVLGHFLPPHFSRPRWLQSAILKMLCTENAPCSSGRSLRERFATLKPEWREDGRGEGSRTRMWDGVGAVLRRACRICAQGDQVVFFWNKELEAWEGLGLVSQKQLAPRAPQLPPGDKHAEMGWF